MPLKKRTIKLTKNPNPVNEGSIIKTPSGEPMSLFERAKLPMVTLQANQFTWPKSLVVMEAKRVEERVVNPETGWNVKDENGDYETDGNYNIRLQVADGELAQAAIDRGSTLDGLNTLQCTIKKDIPIQKFVPQETLIELVNPNVMLGFGGSAADRILLVADDYKEV